MCDDKIPDGAVQLAADDACRAAVLKIAPMMRRVIERYEQ